MKFKVHFRADTFFFYLMFCAVAGLTLENIILMSIYGIYNMVIIQLSLFAFLISCQIFAMFIYVKKRI